jgi:hypothetical protein
MALNSADVRVGISGAICFAPVGTPAPRNATDPLPEVWRDVGYLSEDGLEEERTRSLQETTAWQNADVVRVSVTSAAFTTVFTMIETNRNSVELYYGRPVAADGSVVIDPGETGPRRAMVFDYVDGDAFCRLHMPEVSVTEVDTQTVNSSDPVGYTTTITAYRNRAARYAAKKWYSALATDTGEQGDAGDGEAS